MTIQTKNSPPAPPLIMGILNATPDSFYDGGLYEERSTAVTRANEMIDEGAAIIDIGGESTGPGSMEVSDEEELRRIIPIISLISRISIVSVDTTKSAIARAALEEGAAIVNDVSAGRNDPAMFPLVAEKQCDIIMMYSKDPSPRTTVREQRYDDVMATVKTFLADRIAAAESAGIRREHIIVDPGLGHFISSDPAYSWEILERLGELADLGCPILVSPSRKSFTADHPGDPPEKRLPGTLRATKRAIQNGATIIRTHDVKETISLSPPPRVSSAPPSPFARCEGGGGKGGEGF